MKIVAEIISKIYSEFCARTFVSQLIEKYLPEMSVGDFFEAKTERISELYQNKIEESLEYPP